MSHVRAGRAPCLSRPHCAAGAQGRRGCQRARGLYTGDRAPPGAAPRGSVRRCLSPRHDRGAAQSLRNGACTGAWRALGSPVAAVRVPGSCLRLPLSASQAATGPFTRAAPSPPPRVCRRYRPGASMCRAAPRAGTPPPLKRHAGDDHQRNSAPTAAGRLPPVSRLAREQNRHDAFDDMLEWWLAAVRRAHTLKSTAGACARVHQPLRADPLAHPPLPFALRQGEAGCVCTNTVCTRALLSRWLG